MFLSCYLQTRVLWAHCFHGRTRTTWKLFTFLSWFPLLLFLKLLSSSSSPTSGWVRGGVLAALFSRADYLEEKKKVPEPFGAGSAASWNLCIPVLPFSWTLWLKKKNKRKNPVGREENPVPLSSSSHFAFTCSLRRTVPALCLNDLFWRPGGARRARAAHRPAADRPSVVWSDYPACCGGSRGL